MRTTSLAFGLCSAVALAQSSVPAADVEHLWPEAAGRGSMWVGNGQTLKSLQFRSGVSLFSVHDALHSEGGHSSLVHYRLGCHVFAALGLVDWLEVSAVAPVIIAQEGSASLGLATAGLGNPWLQLKARLLGEDRPVLLSLALGVGVPIGSWVAQGNGGTEASPKLQFGKRFSTWQFAAEIGFLYRPTVDFSPLTADAADRVGSQWWLSGAVIALRSSGPRGELSVRVQAPLTGNSAGVEAQVGVRWPLGDVEWFVTAGPGVGGGPSTPAWRLNLGAAFGNAPPTAPGGRGIQADEW